MTELVIDVHQHLWPEELVEALRARDTAPFLDGWTLRLAGEPPYDVDPAEHDQGKRAAAEADAGIDQVLLSLSSPLGIEWLPPDEAAPLLDAWHDGALALAKPFQVWAAANMREPDPAALRAALAAGCIGLQIPADAMQRPADLERIAPLFAECERQNRPVLVHPGQASCPAEGVPGWWAPVLDYVGQLHAAWWSWHVAGRSVAPELRICFAAGAGLAPVHYERLVARGGTVGRIDPNCFVDTSSYGPRGLDALIRVLGIDPVVFGSDRPYAEPTDPGMGAAATRAIRCSNPRRLLEGGLP
ncbi:putative TIM-barrel fold metal-dependent hydrolase [Tamaricihabitans halophyticus]|uniref:Putative TIM-barrel fold metal-dependent hydrolase n=1 Tax=Tamaricihabitans halophyticus TaxID=1262583 RepID=A0A4R2PZC0_9PSEU|nr:amidohydrolase family protein [Tamaricihabitans halophyticus]TCP41633.1 putative TIM-barrel fold metal-dependent hydrolase [Tamaricihabitans halophyticus]